MFLTDVISDDLHKCIDYFEALEGIPVPCQDSDLIE